MTTMHSYNLRSRCINFNVVELKKEIKTYKEKLHDKNLILVFDVETTGLIQRNYITKKRVPLKECPFITQISFIIYDISKKKKIETFNSYIKIDPSIIIPQIVIDITGITQEKCQNQGITMTDALISFYKAYCRCGTMVAHNIVFDRDMILIEIERNYKSMPIRECPYPYSVFDIDYIKATNIELYCTMIKSLNVCNLMVESKRQGVIKSDEIIKYDFSSGQTVKTRFYKKMPKLSELYFHFFGVIPENLHDSLVDTEICLKCYLKLTQ